MPDHRRATCRNCGVHRSTAGLLSWNGYCGQCGPELFEQATDELHRHDGPTFDHWRMRVAASVGAVLVDYLDLDP